MNRLKTGPILRIPDVSEIATISPDAADKEVKRQTASWKTYRQKLAADSAAVTSASEEPMQMATGRITTLIEGSPAAAKEPSKELLKLSKGETLEGSSSEDAISVQDKIRSMEENAIAREKALNEANERVALLEKNIMELQRLLELKSPTLAVPPVVPPMVEEPPLIDGIMESIGPIIDGLRGNIEYVVAAPLLLLTGIFGAAAIRRKKEGQFAL